MALLEVKNLSISMMQRGVSADLVKDISFSLNPGEIAGMVGESGCGKSITALSMLRLIKPPLKISSGKILYEGADLLALGKREIRSIRGSAISMIFQEPMTSLHPLMSVGEQIGETIREHLKLSKAEERRMVIDLLRQVGINSPESRAAQFPHELSGGMRQRIMIAIALSCNSKVLLADEPTTALDVTIQAQILELLKRLNRERGLGVLLISHDLGVIAETCRRVMVLYAGEIVEEGLAGEILEEPFHPYTQALLKSIPGAAKRSGALFSIPGRIPPPAMRPGGCYFAPRCSKRMPECERIHPDLTNSRGERKVRCLLYTAQGEKNE